MNWFIREATLEDAVWIGRRIRRADGIEALSHGIGPQEGLVRSVMDSRASYTVVVDGYPCVLYGYTDSAMIWMMSTDNIYDIPLRDLVTQARRIIKDFWVRLDHRTMVNWIHEENTAHLRFIKFLGGSVYAARNHRHYFEIKGDH